MVEGRWFLHCLGFPLEQQSWGFSEIGLWLQTNKKQEREKLYKYLLRFWGHCGIKGWQTWIWAIFVRRIHHRGGLEELSRPASASSSCPRGRCCLACPPTTSAFYPPENLGILGDLCQYLNVFYRVVHNDLAEGYWVHWGLWSQRDIRLWDKCHLEGRIGSQGNRKVDVWGFWSSISFNSHLSKLFILCCRDLSLKSCKGGSCEGRRRKVQSSRSSHQSCRSSH